MKSHKDRKSRIVRLKQNARIRRSDGRATSPARLIDTKFGTVAIGRNEGERLIRCLNSLSASSAIVYVDSGSTDGSPQRARGLGVEVVHLDTGQAFTAARARNQGFRRLRQIAPDLTYVQFVDGDCEIIQQWPSRAIPFLNAHPNVGAVCGQLRERHPEHSIYNWLCEREWDVPAGEVSACGGIAMMCVAAFDNSGGFRDDLIAGEEPELCVRLRAVGWKIWRLDADMATHDAAMTRFGQWWSRSMRTGYAFAQGAYLHGALPERHKVWESRRTWLWAIWLPLACVITGLSFPPWGWLAWAIYPAQIARQTLRNPGTPYERFMLSFFQMLSRFPEGIGQVMFVRDRLLGRQARLIEYK